MVAEIVLRQVWVFRGRRRGNRTDQAQERVGLMVDPSWQCSS